MEEKSRNLERRSSKNTPTKTIIAEDLLDITLASTCGVLALDRVEITCSSWYTVVSLRLSIPFGEILVYVPLSRDEDPRASLSIDVGYGAGEILDRELEEAIRVYKLFWRNGKPTEVAMELANAIRNVLSKCVVCRDGSRGGEK